MSTDAKPTSGEWTASEMTMSAANWKKLNDGSPLVIVTRGADVIAAVWCGDDKDGEEIANGNLIAAAQELLEVLEDARAELDVSTLEHEDDSPAMASIKEVISKIDAAIAKATGAK